MPGSEYTAAPSTGKLKLKGVQDSRVSKKKKKKPAETRDNTSSNVDPARDGVKDSSVMLKQLEDEDAQIRRETSLSATGQVDDARESIDKPADVSKTAAELRFEERRRKRLEERLKREGVKTHKQRVEELNRYLSGLSEHHDMPKIGPG